MFINLGIEDCSIDVNKDNSIDEEKIESLRERILGDETLNSRTDDAFISCFLRARKHNEDDAFNYIKKYYDVRKKFPIVFKNLVPSAVKEALEMKIVGYFKNTDENGSVMVAGTCRCWDPSKVVKWEALRSAMLMFDSLVSEELVQVNGVIFFMDFRQAVWSQILHITPNYIYTFVSCFFGNFPMRYKQIHVLTDSATAYWVAACLVPFFPRKIKAKTHIHASGFESLHKLIDPKYLPEDYGGELPPFDPTYCYRKLRENESFFEECETYWTKSEDE